MKYLFVSPHLDDVVISCGGLISKIEDNRNIDILTVFAGTPPLKKYSAKAAEFHNECGLDFNDPVAIRRIEDRKVANYLKVNGIHWDFFDCIYRQKNNKFIYNNNKSIFSRQIKDQNCYVNEIISQIKTLDLTLYELIFLPLAIGSHIDHIICRKLFEENIKQSNLIFRLRYYEDSPYCMLVDVKDYQRKDMVNYLEKMNLSEFNNKVEAIKGYDSQVRMLFGHINSVKDKLLNYSNFLASSSKYYYERYWKMK